MESEGSMSPHVVNSSDESPTDGPDFRILLHMERVVIQNVAIIVRNFGRHGVPTVLERAVVETIGRISSEERQSRRTLGTTFMAPPRAAVVLVTQERRASALRDLLQTHTFLRVAVEHLSSGPQHTDPAGSSSPSVSSRKNIEEMFRDHDVVIAHSGHVLNELRAGDLSMLRISLLVFDEAEKAHSKGHDYSVLMREFYRCLPGRRRPRVFAISTTNCLSTAVEENLDAKFPLQNPRIPAWVHQPRAAEGKPLGTLADVEHLHFANQGSLKNSTAERLSEDEILIGELGNVAVWIYRLHTLRGMSSLYYSADNENAPKLNEKHSLRGLSPKAITLLHLLERAYKASTNEEKLMAIVHAGSPVVATALHGIISVLRVFDGMVCRVLLGDGSNGILLGHGFQANEEQKVFQSAKPDDEAVDDFGAGVANVLIVASSNMNIISQNVRPFPPCPLVIRFDESAVDFNKDGGGGRCRVIVFKPQTSPKRRIQKRKQRDVQHVMDGQDGFEDEVEGEDAPARQEATSPTAMNSKVPDLSDGGAVPLCQPLHKAHASETQSPTEKQLGEASCGPYRMNLNPVETVPVSPESDNCRKKRKSTPKSSAKQKLARYCGTNANDDGRQGDCPDAGNISTMVGTAKALGGPQGDAECFLYGLKLRGKIRQNGPGGIEDYGVILSQKLSDRDLTISVGDLGFRYYADAKVGNLGLVFLGTIILSLKQLSQAQQFVSCLFSKLLENVRPHLFVWEKPSCNSRNYLIVPIIWKQGSDRRIESHLCNEVYPPANPAQDCINWDHILTTINDGLETEDNSEKNAQGLMQGVAMDGEKVIPRLGMEHLIVLLRGTPAANVVRNFAAVARNPTPVLPEVSREQPMYIGAMFLPSCLMALERQVLLCELRDLCSRKANVPVQLHLLSEAVTSAEVDPVCNYERLELLGDSVLKLTSTIRLFTRNPGYSEGRMHDARKTIVSNGALTERARVHELEKFLCVDRPNVDKWMPPGSDHKGRVVTLPGKRLADVVEALAGVLYLSGSDDYNRAQEHPEDTVAVTERETRSLLSIGAMKRGYETSVKLLETFAVVEGREPTHKGTLLSAIHSLHPVNSKAPTDIVPEAFPREPRLARPKKPWEEEFGPLENVLGYKFKRRHFLICALTHGSYIDKSVTSSTMSETFQRLEFLGDAVADFCVVLYLYDKYPLLGPGELTELKGLVVSNETFARVSVRFGLHKYLFFSGDQVKNGIEAFEEQVKKEMQNGDANLQADDVESCAAPKVLGDVFESIIGAIMVDSGLEEAWRVAMKLLREMLTERMDPRVHILHPMRMLDMFMSQSLGIVKGRAEYEFIEGEADQFSCTVKIVGQVIACANAASKRIAQLDAAKKAFIRLRNAKPGSSDHVLIEHLMRKATEIAIEKRSSHRKND